MLIRDDISVAAEVDWLVPAAKRRGSPERGAQTAIVAYLKAALPAGSVVFAVKNEHRASGRTKGQRARFGAMRKAEGVSTGFPDIGVLLPGGRAVFIEVKAPRTGRLSGAQRERHAELRRLGFGVGVATSIETAELALRALGVPLKATAA